MKKQISKYSLADTFLDSNLATSASVNCQRIGVIQSFNPTTQRASVQLVDLIYLGDGSTKTPSILEDIPVSLHATYSAAVLLPINAGDFCTVSFNDRDLSNWKTSGGTEGVPLATFGLHTLNDGVCVTGVFPNPKPLTYYNNTALEMFFLKVSDNTVQAKISLDTKVGITNATQSLKTIIDSLCDLVNNELMNTVIANLMNNVISGFISTMSGAKTIPAVVGTQLTFDPSVISSLSSLSSQLSSVISQLSTTSTNLNTIKSNFDALLK
jgi:hypothetical protein